MIYIRVELWPGGDKYHPRVHVLAEGTIANVTGGGTHADYFYSLKGKRKSPMGTGEIKGFPRKRLMAWDLIYRVLHHARSQLNEVSPSRG